MSASHFVGTSSTRQGTLSAPPESLLLLHAILRAKGTEFPDLFGLALFASIHGRFQDVAASSFYGDINGFFQTDRIGVSIPSPLSASRSAKKKERPFWIPATRPTVCSMLLDNAKDIPAPIRDGTETPESPEYPDVILEAKQIDFCNRNPQCQFPVVPPDSWVAQKGGKPQMIQDQDMARSKYRAAMKVQIDGPSSTWKKGCRHYVGGAMY